MNRPVTLDHIHHIIQNYHCILFGTETVMASRLDTDSDNVPFLAIKTDEGEEYQIYSVYLVNAYTIHMCSDSLNDWYPMDVFTKMNPLQLIASIS